MALSSSNVDIAVALFVHVRWPPSKLHSRRALLGPSYRGPAARNFKEAALALRILFTTKLGPRSQSSDI